MDKAEKGTKRIGVVVNDELYERIEKNAQKRNTTVTDRARKYFDLGATVDEYELSGEAEFIIRYKNGKEQGIKFF